MIEKLVQKLDLIGADIIAYNDFGIVYREKSGKPVLLKITYSKDGEQVIDKATIEDFENFAMGDHFIVLNIMGEASKSYIFIKTSNKNLVSTARHIYLHGDTRIHFKSNMVAESSQVIGYTTQGGYIALINYKGKKIDITKYMRKYRSDIAMCIERYGNRYRVGFGDIRVRGQGADRIQYISELNYWFIDADEDFKDVRYNPNLADYYFDKRLAQKILDSQPH